MDGKGRTSGSMTIVRQHQRMTLWRIPIGAR
jgi:hypothetical protein